MLSFCLILFSSACQSFGSSPVAAIATPGYRPDRILIKPYPEATPEELAAFHSEHDTEVLQSFKGFGDIQVIRLPPGQSVREYANRYRASGLVQFAEPDYLVRAAATIPNDPKFLDGTLWGLDNYGQNGWTPDADIDAPEAWDVMTSASNIVIAVLDTGIHFTHEDLASNMWVNPLGGGHGFNAFTNYIEPEDDNGHGTMVAGNYGCRR
jgi:subtilisin family serine protease